MPPVLDVRSVGKAYGPLRAVADVSFAVEAGQVLGLLGPNGAGKTTTVSMIAGLLVPDSGQVLVKGGPISGERDPRKAAIGLVPQELALWEELPAQDNLRIFGSLYGLGGAALDEAVSAWLGFVGLQDRAADRVATFSGGMKRRLNLAAGLLHDPDLVLLDEPTVGVDPQSRNALFDALLALRARGKALVYTTHYMEEAERLCDDIVIVDHGKVIAHDTVRGLYGLLPNRSRVRVELDTPAGGTWLDELRVLDGVQEVVVEDGVLRATLVDVPKVTPSLVAFLAARGLTWSHLQIERPDLEAVFLALTGRTLRD